MTTHPQPTRSNGADGDAPPVVQTAGGGAGSIVVDARRVRLGPLDDGGSRQRHVPAMRVATIEPVDGDRARRDASPERHDDEKGHRVSYTDGVRGECKRSTNNDKYHFEFLCGYVVGAPVVVVDGEPQFVRGQAVPPGGG